MEEPDHTIENDDQPSEATKWAEDADGEDIVLDDDVLDALEDEDEPNDLD